MRDNDVIRVFRQILIDGLASAGYVGVDVVQANQPTMQGVNINPTVYFFKVSDHRYGFPLRQDTYDEINEVMLHSQVQQYETTFQLSALVRQNPRTPNAFTASDLVNDCALILSDTYSLTELDKQDIAMLRITDVINPYFTDDRDQYEAHPSFDFTLTYKRARVSEVPVIESTIIDIKRV